MTRMTAMPRFDALQLAYEESCRVLRQWTAPKKEPQPVNPGDFGTYQPAAPSSRDLWALQHQAQIVVTNNYVCDGETGV